MTIIQDPGLTTRNGRGGYVREATPLDLLRIVATRRRQRILRLNPPYSLIQPQSLVSELLRTQVPFKFRAGCVLVYLDKGYVQGFVQARPRWGRDEEWAVTTLATLDRAPYHVSEALLEAVSQAAGESGVLRLFVKVPSDESDLPQFRRLGFTHYTNEHIWGHLYFAQRGQGTSADEPAMGQVRKQSNSDAWDLLQLYSAVTPPAVQRAETLSSRNFRRSYFPRPMLPSSGLVERAYVWSDASGQKQSLGGYMRLVTGARAHWLTTMFRPDAANRDICPQAFDYVLWKAARSGHKPVYCGVRDYQAEVGGILEARGFHHFSEQALLVKYLAEPIKVKQPVLAPFLARNTTELVTTAKASAEFRVPSAE
ncbi:MAG: hypothetical protein M3437_10430 [Chloroflexota bacterium]|nr:hypothetical protein [Chloroflexota bacterium]MDQ5866160.1 hypothetical protein [Chloroflexota bacterium]